MWIAATAMAVAVLSFAPECMSEPMERDVIESTADVAARPPVSLAGSRVAEAIAARLLDVHGVPPQDVRIPALLDLEALASEPGNTVIVDVPSRTGSSPSLPVTVAIVQGGRVLQRVAVTARIVIERPVLIAARTLARGATIRVDDVREELRADAPADALDGSAAVIGQRLVRGVAAGAPLREAFLEAIPVVTRGQSVTLRASRGSLAIEAAGRALEDGRTGETIRVMNIATRRVLAGQVASDGAIDMGF
jgi:flagella basal body P-ring formation protein FlgA